MKGKIMLIVKTNSNESSKYTLYRLSKKDSINDIIYDHLKLLKINVNLNNSLEEINKFLEDNNTGINFEIYTDYDKQFNTFEEKCKFRDAIEYVATNNHYITDDTIFIWDYESSEWIDAGSWAWSNDINDIIDCYKYVILDRILGYVYEGVMTIEDREILGLDELIQNLIWREGIEKTNKFGTIKDLLEELEKEKTFEKLEYVAEEIQKQCELLKIKCDVYVFKGLKYPKMLVRAHGNEYDEMNLFKTFKEDYLA